MKEDAMSILVPRNCASRDCGGSLIESIHTASRRLDLHTPDGLPVFAHHITYRCAQCSNTWAVQGTSSQDLQPGFTPAGAAPESRHGSMRGW